MPGDKDRARLYLSAQRALLGAIGPSVLGVAIDGSADPVKMQVFVEDALSEEEVDDFEDAATEIMADFLDWPVDVSIVEDQGQLLRAWTGRWVFLRRGVRVTRPADAPSEDQAPQP
jgi:hypothetical protein